MGMKFQAKIIVDMCMVIALPFLMAQALIGEVAHEWIGTAMLVLTVIHTFLNRSWYKNLLRGKYSAFRIIQTLLDVAILICMLGLMVSGIMMSRYVFASFAISSGSSFARILHMLSAYWGFTLMMVHLGFHGNMMMGITKKAARITKPSKARTTLLRTVAIILCGYGAYAFAQREIGTYMLLQNQYVFFDFREPLIFFFVDYIAIMGLFVCAGHYFSTALRKLPAIICKGKNK